MSLCIYKHGCLTKALFGKPGIPIKKEYCCHHAPKGYVNVGYPRCAFQDCIRIGGGHGHNDTKIYCVTHANETMRANAAKDVEDKDVEVKVDIKKKNDEEDVVEENDNKEQDDEEKPLVIVASTKSNEKNRPNVKINSSLNDKKCLTSGCPKNAITRKHKYCMSHQIKNSRAIVKKTKPTAKKQVINRKLGNQCARDGCTKRGYCKEAGNFRQKFCFAHAPPSCTSSSKTRKCQVDECSTIASYAKSKGGRREFCATHCPVGHMNPAGKVRTQEEYNYIQKTKEFVKNNSYFGKIRVLARSQKSKYEPLDMTTSSSSSSSSSSNRAKLFAKLQSRSSKSVFGVEHPVEKKDSTAKNNTTSDDIFDYSNYFDDVEDDECDEKIENKYNSSKIKEEDKEDENDNISKYNNYKKSSGKYIEEKQIIDMTDDTDDD